MGLLRLLLFSAQGIIQYQNLTRSLHAYMQIIHQRFISCISHSVMLLAVIYSYFRVLDPVFFATNKSTEEK